MSSSFSNCREIENPDIHPMTTPVVATECETPERFTESEVEQFGREGFVIVRGMVEADVINEMIASTMSGLDGLIGPIEYEADVQYPGSPAEFDSQGGLTVRRLKQALSRDFVFTQWLTDPKLVCRLQQILGRTVIMPLAHHNCIMTKQPVYSSDTGWHQDIRYWSFESPELVSVWLSLGHEYPDNGCLQLIPGTHRITFDRSRLDENLFLNPDLPENQKLINSKIHAELQPGDVLFFHCRTLHAASRNFTDEPKFSAVFTFRGNDNPPRPGTRSASLPELLLTPETQNESL